MMIAISAVGDMCFHIKGVGDVTDEVLSGIVHELEDSHVSIGNLESPLIANGKSVQGKCSLQSDPDWAKVIKEAGINIVSLANNHMMDYGETGLLSTIQALDSVGIKYLGAGRDRKEACAPSFLDIRGRRVAFLARTSVIVSSPSYAGDGKSGVAFFDEKETKEKIRECKRQADSVILLMHWGLEEYSYPSPSQRRIAKQLIEVGADLILGHHPHVLQGVEKINHGLVAYSLGNFLFDDLEWSFVDGEGRQCNRIVELKKENRRGGILKVGLSENGIESYDFTPTFIKPEGRVVLDESSERKQEFVQLCSRLYMFQYPLFWKSYSLWKEWSLRIRPTIQGKMTWSNLKKVRPRHFKELGTKFKRSARITSERSTNPYE